MFNDCLNGNRTHLLFPFSCASFSFQPHGPMASWRQEVSPTRLPHGNNYTIAINGTCAPSTTNIFPFLCSAVVIWICPSRIQPKHHPYFLSPPAVDSRYPLHYCIAFFHRLLCSTSHPSFIYFACHLTTPTPIPPRATLSRWSTSSTRTRRPCRWSTNPCHRSRFKAATGRTTCAIARPARAACWAHSSPVSVSDDFLLLCFHHPDRNSTNAPNQWSARRRTACATPRCKPQTCSTAIA